MKSEILDIQHWSLSIKRKFISKKNIKVVISCFKLFVLNFRWDTKFLYRVAKSRGRIMNTYSEYTSKVSHKQF